MKNVRLNYLFLLILSVLSLVASAQDKGRIAGKIIDRKTGEELIGVSVQIEGTSIGAVTDFEGKYLIAGVTPGRYSLIVSYISYNKKVISGVEVKAKDVTSVNVSMEEQTKDLNEVVVTAEVKRESAAGLLIQQKNATTISDGISAEAIRRTPDRNTSDVLKRVSGASIQDNKFAIIRGLNERYTTAYINGAPLPSSESDRKAFSFDIFPSNLLDNLVILKTATPDMPAEFGGGIIEINTKSIPDNNFQSFSISGGYNTLTTFKDQLTYEGGKTDWLGVDDGTRAVPSGIPSNKNFPVSINEQAQLGKLMKNDWGLQTKTFTPNYGLQYTLGRVWGQKTSKLGLIFAVTYSRTNNYNTVKRKQYDSNYDQDVPVVLTSEYEDQNYSTQTLTGVMANVSYKVNANHQFTFKNLYSISADDKVILRNGTPTPLDPNPVLVQSTAQWFTSNKIYSTQLGGIHYLTGSKVKINWVSSFGEVKRDIPNLRRNSYNKLTYVQPTGDPDIAPNPKDTVYKANIAQANVGPDYAGNRFYATTTEKIYSIKADASRSLDMKSAHLKNMIKVGGLAQQRDRDFTANQYGYIKYVPGGVGSGVSFPDSILYLPQDQLFAQQYMGQSSANFGGYALSNKYKPTDSYSAKSKLTSGFIMFDNRYKERYRLIWGVRVESFEQDLYTTLDNGTPLDIITKKTDFLPSANLVVSVTESQNIRLSYSQTVNRPEFRELAPFAFYDFSTRFVVSGNSSLTRALIHNYDARYEWYPGKGQLVSVSGFYKKFINPIEQVARPDVSNEITYRNVKSADNFGLEFEFRLLIGAVFNATEKSWLNELTVFSNLTLITSTVDVSDVVGAPEKNRPLQGQSPYIINSGIQYFNNKSGWTVSANYNKVGQRIYIVGYVNEPDIWENGRDVIDLQAGKSFFKNKLDIRVNLKDVLAQNQYFFQDHNHNHKLDKSQDNLIWVANYGRTISMNITYKF
jgi:outer membrane receptor protein involved in Fe transport